MDELILIAVWADGTWCHLDIVEEYDHKSDDYREFEVPLNEEEEAVENIIKRGLV